MHMTASYLVADLLAGSVATCECAAVCSRRRCRRPGERCRGLVVIWEELHYFVHWDGERALLLLLILLLLLLLPCETASNSPNVRTRRLSGVYSNCGVGDHWH